MQSFHMLCNGSMSLHAAGSEPGQCWAFAGSAGNVTLELSEAIVPGAIVIEHSRAAMLTPARTSAPNAFKVRILV